MTLLNHYTRLLREMENGVKLSDEEILSRINEIVACAKEEKARSLATINKILPILNNRMKAIANADKICDKCAGLMFEMRGEDVIAE